MDVADTAGFAVNEDDKNVANNAQTDGPGTHGVPHDGRRSSPEGYTVIREG